jgi:ATP-dependent Lon protease
MSLGGVRDEAEIRGHRRTYIGSMPGKILQNMSKVGVRNPLFLLDEVDKMGMDFRGDPSSALLEVLDPSRTARSRPLRRGRVRPVRRDVRRHGQHDEHSGAALDRMEVIRLSGYTEDEKIAIAKQYLLPKQIKLNGSSRTSCTSPTARCATSSATTRARPACAISSATSARSAARW